MIARARGAVVVALVAGLMLSGVAVSADGAPARTKAPKCTIIGTKKADRLVGTGHRDVICGRGGNDVIVGGKGKDVLVGGAGSDTISGGAGKDTLEGGPGDDALDGGPAADDLDGGAGDNVCTVDASDEADQCLYDRTAPKASSLSVSTSSVDVTNADREAVYRVHVTDDTGVESVSVEDATDAASFPKGWADQTGPIRRKGWYEITLTFPHWSVPATFHPRVVMWDRMGRRSVQDFDGPTVSVRNSDPDLDLPVVTLLAPAPTQTIDTRSSAARVNVRVRITDAMSGVDPEYPSATLTSPDGRFLFNIGLDRVSGTTHDGIWTASSPLTKQSLAGDWTLAVDVSDLASHGTRRRVTWLSARALATTAADPGEELRAFPGDLGVVPVLGRTRTDLTPPTIASATVSPTVVDTLAAPAQVGVSVHASDAGVGVDNMQARLVSVDDTAASYNLVTNPPLASGTVADGIWTGSFSLPQGLPPGTYYLQVYIWDTELNAATYSSSQYPYAGGDVLQGATTVTVVSH